MKHVKPKKSVKLINPANQMTVICPDVERIIPNDGIRFVQAYYEEAPHRKFLVNLDAFVVVK